MQQYAEMKLTETMSFIAEKRRDRLSAARVTWNKLAKDKPLTAAVATQVLMANQDCVAFLPKEKLSEEICEAVLEMSPLSISFIPEEMRTEQMSYTALNAYKKYAKTDRTSGVWQIVEILSAGVQTENICLLAAKQTKIFGVQMALACGLLGVCKYRTDTVIKDVLSYLPLEIIFLTPEEMKPQFLKIAMRISCGQVILYLDKTVDLCMMALKQNAFQLGNMSDFLETCGPEERERLIFAALSINGLPLQYVPKHMITKEMCFAAVGKDAGAIQYVPEELLSCELVDLAFERAKREDGTYAAIPSNSTSSQPFPSYAILSFPQYVSEKYFLPAVRETDGALSYLPEEMISDEVCYAALQHSYKEIAFFPERFLTDDNCLMCIRRYQDEKKINTNLPLEISQSLFKKVARVALKQDGMLLSCLPSWCITKPIIRAAVTQTSGAFRFVPEKKQTPDVQELVVKLDPELLRYIAHPTKEAVLLCLRHKEDSSIVEPLISDMSGQEVVETLEELGISLLPDYA